MKKLFTPFLALGFALSVANLSAVEYKTLIANGSDSETITLQNGDLLEIVSLLPKINFYDRNYDRTRWDGYLQIANGSNTINIPSTFEVRNDNRTANKPWIGSPTFLGRGMIITGPASFTCKGVCMGSFRITTATEIAAAGTTKSKYATVIPENAKTNVNVVLEQSTDLVNWTAVAPGQFAPSAQKRFFRLRSANVPVAVTGATNASPIVVTSTGHSLNTGDAISISGVAGNTAANGTFTVTKVDANTFSLNGSTGNAAYTSGGTWLPSP